MKRWIAIISILVIQGCFSLPDPNLVVIPVVERAGSFTDARDGNEYPLVKVGDQTWMATNLKYAGAGSVCLLNDNENCETYGRLYTLTEALQACPTGFQLPSVSDFENLWKGLGIKDPGDAFTIKFPKLIDDNFSWRASGFYHAGDNAFYRKDVDGLFHTKTMADANNSNIYIWHSISQTAAKSPGGLSNRFACLCIKD